MKKIIKPNTFLLEVQKSAITSVSDWISQHQEVCVPIALKDYPFFLEDEKYSKGIETLQDAFNEEGYNEKNKIVLLGNVQYIFHKKAAQRIPKFFERDTDFLPRHKRTKIRLKTRAWSTSDERQSDSKLFYEIEMKELQNYYKNDISELKITTEQTGTPTNGNDLAKSIFQGIKSKSNKYGFYNVSNTDEANWYDFAKAILQYTKQFDSTKLAKTDHYRTFATRPEYSVLCNSK